MNIPMAKIFIRFVSDVVIFKRVVIDVIAFVAKKNMDKNNQMITTNIYVYDYDFMAIMRMKKIIKINSAEKQRTCVMFLYLRFCIPNTMTHIAF